MRPRTWRLSRLTRRAVSRHMSASLRPLTSYKSARLGRIGALPLCLGVFFTAGSAYAQTPSPEDMAAARSLGTAGVQLADKGDCVTAIPKLDAAEKLFHAPTTLERLGECCLLYTSLFQILLRERLHGAF